MDRRIDRLLPSVFVAACLAVGLLAPRGARASTGPLPAVNLAPQHLFFLEPAPESPTTTRGRAFGLDLGYATVYVASDQGGTHTLFDMEVARIALSFSQALPARSEVGIQLPLLWMGSGVFDRPLIAYHRMTGFADGGRRDAPINEFRYSFTDGKGTYSPDPDGRLGLGDLVLHFKKELLDDSSGLRLAGRVLAKLPTGDPGKGYGSGKADGGLGLLADTRLGPIGIFGTVDVLYLGGTPDPVLTLSSHWTVKAVGGLSFPLWRLGDLTAQVDYLASPYDTGSPVLDQDTVMLAAGFQRTIGGFGRWTFGFTEDLAVRTSPDFSLFASVEW